MIPLEDRLREALDHPVDVRGEELLVAAHRGVRRRRTRRALGVSLAATAAVAAVVAGLTLAAGDRAGTGPAGPSTPTPTPTAPEPGPVEPSPGYVMSTTSTGHALYMVLLPCAEAVAADAPAGSSRPHVCADDEASSTLWRYRSGTWEELGPLPGGVAGIVLGPDGRSGIGVDWWQGLWELDRLPFTLDGGRSWTELELPAGDVSEVFVTSTDMIVTTWRDGWFAAPIGSDEWRAADPPDADSAGEHVPFVVGDRLVAEFLGDQIAFDNRYWVSEDAGRSWDGPRRFPGVHSSIFGSTTSGLVVQCVAAYHVPCGQYLSTDLATWQELDLPDDQQDHPLGGTAPVRWDNRLVDPSDGRTLCRLGAGPDAGWGYWTAVGGEMFATVFRAYTADGRLIDPNGRQGTEASTFTRTLMVSRDGCLTWEPLFE